MKRRTLSVVALLLAIIAMPSKAEDGASLSAVFEQEVDRKLAPPPEAQARYAQLAEGALATAGVQVTTSQYMLVLDRNPNVQAVFLYWLDANDATARFHFIGASPASTGKPGRYEHFITPQGVFPHKLENGDYRAQGTRNKLGIRGLGRKGMRVYEFGWVQAQRGWGRDGYSEMRLLLHATDPDRLESSLGRATSKGCVRIPATLNMLIDHYGLLDADYDQALADGKTFWVLRPDRVPTRWPGRYLVIVDSESTERPTWSPEPPRAKPKVATKAKAAAQLPEVPEKSP